MVLYEGKSLIDQQPIVAIATTGSKNRKTGDMIQIWILRSDLHPSEALRTGDDRSVCGDCPVRAGCYVIVANAPRAVFEKYQARGYARATTKSARIAFGAGKRIRIGAYGDPAAVPAKIWHDLLKKSAGHTAYSHQWESENDLARDNAHAMRSILMASVETIEQALKARDLGFRYFRIRKENGKKLPGEIVCPHEINPAITCAVCGLCSGKSKSKSVGIVSTAHGVKSKKIEALLS